MKIKVKTLSRQSVKVFGILAVSHMTLSAQDWWIVGGPVLRGGMDVKITGSSYAQILGLNTDMGVGIGNLQNYANRIYDNGTVNLDPNTGNPNAVGGPGQTWYWGYNNANGSQYTPGSTSLSFTKSGVPRYSNLDNGGSLGDNTMVGGGFQILAGLPIKDSGRWTVDLVLGFQGIWSDHTYRENAGYVNITDTYTVSPYDLTTGSPFPPAYQGTYNGPFDTTGTQTQPPTTIPNLPTGRNYSPGSAPAGAQNSMSFEVQQGFYQLSLGPQVGWSIWRQLS